MPTFVLRMLLIFSLVFIFNSVRLFFSTRAQHTKIEKPSIVQRVGLGVQVAVTILMVLMDLLGFIMKDTEMTFFG